MDFIYKKTKRLKAKHDTNDPLKLINLTGIHLRYFHNINSLQGFYCVVKNHRYISLNGNLTERDREVVAAHELGHDILHRSHALVAPMCEFELFDPVVSRLEREANLFAADLLIGDDTIFQSIQNEMDFKGICSVAGYVPQLVLHKLSSMQARGYEINMPDVPDSGFLGKRP